MQETETAIATIEMPVTTETLPGADWVTVFMTSEDKAAYEQL